MKKTVLLTTLFASMILAQEEIESIQEKPQKKETESVQEKPQKKETYSSVAEWLAKNTYAVPIGKELMVGETGIGLTGGDGRYIPPNICKKYLAGQGTTEFLCKKGNQIVMTFPDYASDAQEKCSNIQGELVYNFSCIKDGKEVARFITGSKGYTDVSYGPVSGFKYTSNHAVFVIKSEKAEEFSSIEHNKDVVRANDLLQALEIKRDGNVLEKEFFSIGGYDKGFQIIFRLARVCKLQGGKFYAKGVSLETYMIASLHTIQKTGQHYTGVYACEGGKEPFTAYVTEKPYQSTRDFYYIVRFTVLRNFIKGDVETARQGFIKENGQPLRTILKNYPEIANGLFEHVRKELEEITGLQPSAQTNTTPIQTKPQISGPGSDLAQEAARKLQAVSKKEGYTLWTARPVGRDEKGCIRVHVVEQNLASPRPDFREYNYSVCEGQVSEAGSPRKYFQVPPQAKEVAQRIVSFCQRHGEASGRWEDVEISCRALRDKDKCLVEITYFDTKTKSLVGIEEVNGCR